MHRPSIASVQFTIIHTCSWANKLLANPNDTHTHTLSSPSRFVPMRPDRRCTFLHVLMDGLKVAGHRTPTKVEGPELDFPSWVPQVTKGVRCTVTGYLSPWPPCKTWRSRSSSPGPWSQRRVVQQTGVPHFHRVLSSLNMEMENG